MPSHLKYFQRSLQLGELWKYLWSKETLLGSHGRHLTIRPSWVNWEMMGGVVGADLLAAQTDRQGLGSRQAQTLPDRLLPIKTLWGMTSLNKIGHTHNPEWLQNKQHCRLNIWSYFDWLWQTLNLRRTCLSFPRILYGQKWTNDGACMRPNIP